MKFQPAYTPPRILFIFALLAVNPLAAVDYTWDGGNGQWTDPAKWTPNGVPDSADKATIASGTVNIPQDGAGVGELIFAGGTIEGPGDLTVAAAMDWHAGANLRGTGTTRITASAVLTFEGDGNRDMQNRTLLVEGTWNVDSEGMLGLQYDSSIVVAAGGLVDFRADAGWQHSYGGAPTITISGTLRKSAGTGNTTVSNIIPSLVAGCAVEAQSGTVVFASGVTGTASFDAEAGAGIQFANGASLEDCSFTGAGQKTFSSGVLTLTGTHNGANVELNGANLKGDHTLLGEWKWLGGMIDGADSSTTIGTGSIFRIIGDTQHQLRERTVLVEGTLIHEGTGTLQLDYAPAISIATGGTLELPTDVFWNHSYGEGPSIINGGQILKSSPGEVRLHQMTVTNNNLLQVQNGSLVTTSAKFNNSGTVEVEGASLTLGGGGTSTGRWEAAENGIISFNSGTPVLTTGTTFAPSGLVRFNGASVNVADPVSIHNLDLTAGTLGGTGTLTITGHLNWSADSNMYDAGATIIAVGATAAISGDGQRDIRYRTLQVDGTLVHTGTARLQADYDAVITVNGLVDVQSDVAWQHSYGGDVVLTNNGTIRKSSGDGELVFHQIKPTQTASGSLEAQSGTIRLPVGINGSGSFSAAAGANLLVQSTSNLADCTFSGDGLKAFTGGVLTLTGTHTGTNVELNGANLKGTHTLLGEWKWLGGMIDGADSTTVIGASSIFRIIGDTQHQLRERTVLVEGTLVHEGTGTLQLDYLPVINIASSGILELATDGNWNHSYGSAPSLSNEGTIRKSVGTGSFSFINMVPVNTATGKVEGNSGTLQFGGGVTAEGIFHADPGAVIEISGNASLSDVSFTGPGTQRLTNGETTLNGTCSAENVELAGANILGTHTLQGTWHWSKGTFKGPGTTTLANGSHLRLIGDALHSLQDREIVNHGMITHLGTGNLSLAGSSTLHNAGNGIINFRSDADWSGVAGTSLINDGVIYKTEGTGGSTLGFDDFQNNGYLIANTGFLTYDFTWTYHLDQGWIYQAPGPNGGFYYFDTALRLWAWTSLEVSPDMYYYTPFGTWVRFLEGTHLGNRWWYVYVQDDYFGEREYAPVGL